MLYYVIGRATQRVGRLQGAATSGREIGQVLWLLAFSLFHTITAQTIGVKPIDPVHINQASAQAITERVQSSAAQLTPTVDRNKGLQEILKEHALQQSGAMGTDNQSRLGLQRADMIISGSAGSSGQRWFINLCMTHVQSGKTIDCKHTTVESFNDLLTITPIITKALIQGTQIEDDSRVTISPDNKPIIIGTQKLIQEIHVYEHKPETHNKKRFIPCSFCQGRGKVPCTDRSGRPCPGGGRMDCPYCSITSLYQGPETRGRAMTGHWR